MFWSCEGPTASILIGSDDETWDVAVEVPVEVVDQIVELAGEMTADIIVMGVHGAGALNRRLFGSTTHHVIREARCPVLTLRA